MDHDIETNAMLENLYSILDIKDIGLNTSIWPSKEKNILGKLNDI